MGKNCPKCGNEMLFKEAVVGLPERWVCSNCGYDAPAKGAQGESADKDAKKRALYG